MNLTTSPVPLARRVAALVALWCATAAPGEVNPYFVGLSQTLTQESNLLRLSSGQDAPDGYSRSDSLSVTSLLAGFDQSFGRQHAYANLSLRDGHYSRNSAFNNQGYTANAGLDWSTIERVSGSLSLSTNRALSNFNNYGVGLLASKNLETTDGLNASFNVGLVTEYSLVASAGHRQVRNSLDNPTLKARDFDQDNVSLGLRWRPRGGTMLGFNLGTTLGRYPSYQINSDGSRQADRFQQPTLDLLGNLQPSGSSSLDARLSYSKTRYDLNQQRNFSGLTGTLGWAWQPGGKTHLSTRLSRDTGQNFYAITVFGVPGLSDYSQVVNTFRVQADYDVTAKITLNVSAQLNQRNIVNTVQNPFMPIESSGNDRTTLLGLGVRWSPLRSLQFGCDLSQETRRASGQLTSDLDNRAVSCFGQFQLQQ